MDFSHLCTLNFGNSSGTVNSPVILYFFTLNRFAKKKFDDLNFYGSVLHICFAPEHESVQETREKLQERRRLIASRIKKIGRLNRLFSK